MAVHPWEEFPTAPFLVVPLENLLLFEFQTPQSFHFLEVDGFLLGKQSPFLGLAVTLGMALIVLAVLFLLGALGGRELCLARTSVLWRTLWWHLNGYWLVKNPLVGSKHLSTHCVTVFSRVQVATV